MSHDVRRAVSGDEALWRAAVGSVLSDERPGSHAQLEELGAALADPRCLLYVALEGDTPVGLLSAYVFPDVVAGGRLAYLYDVEVLPSHRRRGLGRRLVEALLASCHAERVHTVWAGTDRENLAAQRTFERSGAEREGDRYVEYEWELDDAEAGP